MKCSGSFGSIHIAWWSTWMPFVAVRAVLPASSENWTGVDDQ